MKRILSALGGHVLVHDDTGSFKCLRGDLFFLSRDEVDTERKDVRVGLLLTDVEDSDLGVGDSSKVPRLDVRFVLAVSVAACWTSSHGYSLR